MTLIQKGLLPVIAVTLLLASCGGSAPTQSARSALQTGSRASTTPKSTSSYPATPQTVRIRTLKTTSETSLPRASEPRKAAPCKTTQLKITIARSAGTAGTETVAFMIDDATRAPCTLSGFFSIQLLDKRGRMLASRLLPDPNLDGPPRRVMISNASSAEFIYQWGNTQTSAAPCPAAAMVKLTAPNAHDSIEIPARTANGHAITPCGNGSTAVSAVTLAS